MVPKNCSRVQIQFIAPKELRQSNILRPVPSITRAWSVLSCGLLPISTRHLSALE